MSSTKPNPKKLWAAAAKLGVLVRSVRLANNQEAVLRSGGEAKGSSSTAGMVIPVMHGKDITFPKGTEITAYVNGDTRLKRENFQPAPNSRRPAQRHSLKSAASLAEFAIT